MVENSTSNQPETPADETALNGDNAAPETAENANGEPVTDQPDPNAASEAPSGEEAEEAASKPEEAENTGKAPEVEADKPKRDPRIPEIITTRTLFFLAPDLPPRPERPARRDHDSSDDNTGDHESGSGRGRSRSRRNRRGKGNSNTSHKSDADSRSNEQSDDSEDITEPQKLHGSTRLAAKRQRRRDNRDSGRRRPVVTETEFQARREAVDRKMIVRAKDNRVQIGVLEDNVLVEHYVARNEDTSLIGNVYLGRVQNVLPSMEAAFVDIGRARNAVLYSGEVDWAKSNLGANTPRKIENALKPGDKVLVQVTKDPVGHKGARLTSQISLPGRYLVYVPGNTLNGISRKLPDTERTRLKKILKEVLPQGVGVIVRTAAEGATKEQLARDVERLMKQWESIQNKANGGRAPQTLHAEPDMLIKIVRDVFNEDFDKLIVQGQSELDTIKSYLGQVAPDLLDRVERFDGDGDIFSHYRVNEMIDRALARKVWLPSGGSLVIDRTEAMTVVDVNTGKFVGSGGNLEETVTKNNLEAAEEVVRQLRLRDIGGIIVIDFIDMVLESNRDLVLRRLIECLGRDRTKHQVTEVTSLGLVQMTRKKIGLGLLETFSEPCEHCDGRGVHVHAEPVHQPAQSGGGNRQNRGRRKKNSGQQSKSKPQQNGSTHEITDDARNALTKIAASTIAGATQDSAEPSQAAIEASAERLAIAAAAVVSGKSLEAAVAAADAVSDSERGDNNQRNDSAKDADRSSSRRSRRGRRGRNGNSDSGDDKRRNTSASRDSKQDSDTRETDADRGADSQSQSSEPPATSPDDAQPKHKPRRRRVVVQPATDNNEPSERAARIASISLPLDEVAATPAEPASEPAAATLGSLDAALDSLASSKQEAAKTESAQTPRKPRRRITTGPISTDDSAASATPATEADEGSR